MVFYQINVWLNWYSNPECLWFFSVLKLSIWNSNLTSPLYFLLNKSSNPILSSSSFLRRRFTEFSSTQLWKPYPHSSLFIAPTVSESLSQATGGTYRELQLGNCLPHYLTSMEILKWASVPLQVSGLWLRGAYYWHPIPSFFICSQVRSVI